MTDDLDPEEPGPSTAIVPVSANPAPSEWQTMMAIANELAQSDMVPTGYRKKPANIVLAALTGRGLGWDVTTAMRFVHVVEGKPTISAEGMVALVRRAGHSISGETTPTEATARGRRKDTGDEMAVTWTMQAARDAGLASKEVWKKYAPSMLWARAVSQLCRMLFPDVLLGTSYTAEELGDLDYIEGEEPEQRVSVEDQRRIDLRAAISGLGEDDRARLRAWCDESKIPRVTREMTDAQVVATTAFVASLAGITDAEIVEEAPVEPVEAATAPAATDTPDPAPTANEEHVAPPPEGDERDRIEGIRAWVDSLSKEAVIVALGDEDTTGSAPTLRKRLREALAGTGFVAPPPQVVEESLHDRWARYLAAASDPVLDFWAEAKGIPNAKTGPGLAVLISRLVESGTAVPEATS